MRILFSAIELSTVNDSIIAVVLCIPSIKDMFSTETLSTNEDTNSADNVFPISTTSEILSKASLGSNKPITIGGSTVPLPISLIILLRIFMAELDFKASLCPEIPPLFSYTLFT